MKNYIYLILILLTIYSGKTYSQDFENVIKSFRCVDSTYTGNLKKMTKKQSRYYGEPLMTSKNIFVIGVLKDDEVYKPIIYEKNKDGKWFEADVENLYEKHAKGNIKLSTGVIYNNTIIFSTLYSRSKSRPFIMNKDSDGKWIFDRYFIEEEFSDTHNFGAKIKTFNDELYVNCIDCIDKITKNKGIIFVYKNKNGEWIEKQRISESTPRIGYNFSVKDNLMAVVGYSKPRNELLIYKKNSSDNWKHISTIPIENTNKIFPSKTRISIIDKDIIISNPYIKTKNGKTGSAYCYKNNNGTYNLSQDLTPGNIQKLDLFGSSMATNGTYLFISCENRKIDNTKKAGEVYVFKKNASGDWYSIKTLKGNSNYFNMKYGNMIYVDETYLFIGEAKYIIQTQPGMPLPFDGVKILNNLKVIEY